ncbi:hydroxylacyl-CoA dehydrogenase [Streptomyces sp. HUCO-GS316]|uniref:3-hydroxyacyl-CoA dehydrogenase NAD-binding domain-containing protein n=1 Tax=Streptomyces sp. HUCO-GS316 TaxID=2692198 RepID=UPI00136DA7D6|nr:3-hydroxyacyl-CoA dehydrogenase NAD-binding domain-containing protein [Streptomyces sp. HUCO-GS316]MXM68971.1 hydroxylacyl-CoA dehydrogenase [Streptomyces sp. HUCO-GS316]
MSAAKPRTAAVLGTGTIALGWIALFAAKGLDVRVSSTRADVKEHVTRALRLYAPSLPDGAVPVDLLMSRLSFFADVEEAAAGAEVVQENVREDLALKQELFGRAAQAAPEALLLSSTSTLLPGDLGALLEDPARVVVGHPFNPPHIVPLVEVVAADGAEAAMVEAAVDFYRFLGKRPVVLRRAVPGFVANRLQSALLRECIHLMREGVVTVAELDEIVTASIGSRWAVVGPFRAFHLGGGPGGLRHLMAHLGDGLERGWAGLGTPPVDDVTVRTLLDQADEAFGAYDYEELAIWRDAAQNAVIAAVEDVGKPN